MQKFENLTVFELSLLLLCLCHPQRSRIDSCFVAEFFARAEVMTRLRRKRSWAPLLLSQNLPVRTWCDNTAASGRKAGTLTELAVPSACGIGSAVRRLSFPCPLLFMYAL